MSLDVCARCMARVGYRWLRGLSGVWPNAQGLACGRDWHCLESAISCSEDRGEPLGRAHPSGSPALRIPSRMRSR
jgi:hypothetical protein